MSDKYFREQWRGLTRRSKHALEWSMRASGAFARPSILAALLVVLVPLSVILIHPSLHASVNTITVNTLSDSSPPGDHLCSLREAIDNANSASDTTSGDCIAGTGNDSIVFSVSGTISLTSTLPAVANASPVSLTITGDGQDITIDGANSYQVLSVNSGATLTLNGLTIADGNSTSGTGGAINNAGTLSITNSILRNNTASGGGAIYSNGNLTVANSTLSENVATSTGFYGGGAIRSNGSLIVTNSTFSNNSAGGSAGALFAESGTARISGSTFAGNSAPSYGGAIFNNFIDTLTITNSTFSGNTVSSGWGGSIYAYFSTVTIADSTFSGNHAYSGAGGILSEGSSVTVSNSVLANSPSGNCAAVSSGTLINGGYNISDDATCGFGTGTGANGKTIGDKVNPLLDTAGLKYNGGPTQTIALQADSPAVDGDGLCSLREAINNANSPGIDTTGGDCTVGTGKDAIAFSVMGTITLTGTLPAVTNASPGSLTIDGSGQNITIDGGDAYEVLSVSTGATLNLNNLTIAHGHSTWGGGGVFNYGTLALTGCTFSANSAAVQGGAVYNAGILTAANCTFFGSSANFGAAFFNDGSYNAALSVTNSTFSGNSASLGAGIYNYEYGTAAGSTTVTNSILTNSTRGPNCEGTITNGGYNISDDGSCDFGTSTGANGHAIGDNVTDTNLALDPSGLANNGGVTETIALESGSYAIGAVPIAQCTVNTDQRGEPRPAPGYSACDIGAFEYGNPLPTPTATPTTTPTPTPAPTPTATSTLTPTPTTTFTPTPTGTPTQIPTATPTMTAPPAPTATPIPTPTETLTPTSTPTPNIITVNTLSDSSPSGDHLCSLREAINNANSKSDTTGGDCAAGTGNDTINFSVSGAITLGSSLPGIANASGGSLTIDGNGQTVTVSGANSYRVLVVNSGARLNLDDLTITQGSASYAGGIHNVGTLTITNSTVSGNSASYGGGIDNAGTLTVTDSTFSGNSASVSYGGAIDNGGTLTVTNSTFSGNNASYYGGGIWNGGTLTVTNSTFSGNSSTGGIIGNGGNGTTTISNSILAANTALNCSGTITNGGYNISDDATCGFGTSTGANGDTIGDYVNPLLSVGGLANNGGPTQTIALQSGSPAIDAIPIANCPLADQRGFPRPDPEDAPSGACDIGAYETGGLLTVTTLNDETTSGDGLCSLREAINNANSKSDTTGGDCATGTGDDTIVFSVSGTITLGSTLPAIQNNLTIDGNGQTVTIDGANSYRVLYVNSGATLNVNSLTIARGFVAGVGHGGGIYNSASGMLTVTNVVLSNNVAGSGGGIYNDGGNVTVSGSKFSGGHGDGAGISNNSGVATVTGSTFTGNQASEQRGAAVFLQSGSVSISNSTFSGNAANFGGSGGCLYNDGGTLTATNATFSGNESDYDGAVVYSNGGSSTITNSILANNTAANCVGTVTNGGYNISDDSSCGFGTSTGANGRTIGDSVNPLLDTNGLQNNGGPTETIALVTGSPAIAAIPAASCPATDQRGEPRPSPGQSACDIGAFEGSVPAPTPTPTATPSATTTATATSTPTPTTTATATPSPTATPTPTLTPTPTPSETSTQTPTPTDTPTGTPTPTATTTPTGTPTTTTTATPTFTPTSAPTAPFTAIASQTPTASGTTPTPTPTPAPAATIAPIGDDAGGNGSVPASSLMVPEPAGVATNNLFMISVVAIQGSGASTATFTVPSGWSPLTGSPWGCNSGSGSEIAIAAAWKITTANDYPGALLVWGFSNAFQASVVNVVYTGVSTSNPIDVIGSDACASGSVGGDATGSAITTTVTNDTIVGLFAAAGTDQSLFLPFDSLLNLLVDDDNAGLGPADFDAFAPTANLPGAGAATSYGPFTAMQSASGENVGLLIALSPGSFSSPTPTPTPTPTATPIASTIGTPTPATTGTPTPTPSATPTSTATTTPTQTATSTVTPTPTPTLTDTATPSLTPTETSTPSATETPTPTATPTAISTSIATPTVTATATPIPASTIVVNTVSDSSPSGDGLCSLREAINNANAKSDTTSGDCAAG
ncbi:MAG: choice-of-anchor Q domain-containing protein, partial [Candidatus Binataceae bacterium]